MNHLLHQISWQQYSTVALTVAIIYYLVVILRYYRPELEKLQKRIGGDDSENQIQVLQYESIEEELTTAPLQSPGENPYRGEIISNTDFLAGELKACIAKAADQPFAPEVLIPKLKRILREYQAIDATGRPAISLLIVNECENTGTALLTEEEVNQWWES